MTDVRIVDGEPIRLFIAGPNARKARDSLLTIRDEAQQAFNALRHTADRDVDAVRLEVLADALHEATKPMRRAERAHVARFTAEVQARELGMHTTTHDTSEGNPDDLSTSPERHPQ